MVEVIGRDEAVMRETSCRGCAAKLRYSSNDIFTHKYSACGISESDPAIRCPQCQKIILVRY